MTETLKEYQEKTGKTQTEMAQEFRISLPFCNQIINGERRPSPEVAARIEAITGIPLRRLLGLPELSNEAS